MRRAWARSSSKASSTDDPACLRDGALGLLDDDPAVQRALQLLGEDLAAADGPLLQQPDRGDVGQRLHDLHVARRRAAPVAVPKTPIAPITSLAQAQRKRVHGPEARPRWRAGAKCGQRSPAGRRSALTTGAPVRNASRQGPSWACSWNSSSSSAVSSEAAMNCSRPRWSASSRPDRRRVDELGACGR